MFSIGLFPGNYENTTNLNSKSMPEYIVIITYNIDKPNQDMLNYHTDAIVEIIKEKGAIEPIVFTKPMPEDKKS